jgi:hypothetical protein
VLSLGVWLTASCESSAPLDAAGGATPTSDVAGPAEASPSLEVEYAGCSHVVAGPRCQIGAAATLVLWRPTSFRGEELTLGGKPLPTEDHAVSGGYQLRVDVVPGPLELAAPGQAPSFRLELVPSDVDPTVQRAEAAKNAGEFTLALTLAEQAAQTGDAVDRWLAAGVRARALLRLGKVDDAAALLELSTPALFEAGRISDATRDAFALLYLSIDRRFQLDAAARWLERWRSSMAVYPLGRALIDEHDGLLAASTGDWSAALRFYGRAERRYTRLAQQSDLLRIQGRQLLLSAEVGRTREARRRYAQLLAKGSAESVCDRAQMTTLYTWLTMLEIEAGDRGLAPSLPALLRDAEAGERACGDPALRITGLVNRGLWAIEQRDVSAVRAALAELAELPRPEGPYLAAWVAELEGRSALLDQRLTRARAAFEREATLGRSVGQLDPELRALLGLAELAQARGERARGEALLRRAVALLERAHRQAPFGELGQTLWATRQRAAQSLVEQLLERGLETEAHGVAWASLRSALAPTARSRELEALPAPERERYRELLGRYRARRQALDDAASDDWRLSQAELDVAVEQRRSELGALTELVATLVAMLPTTLAAEGVPKLAPGDYRLLFFPLRRDWVVFGEGADGLQTARRAAPLPELSALDVHPMLAAFASRLELARRILIAPVGAAWDWPFERWKLGGTPLAARRLAFSMGLSPLDSPEPPAPEAAAVVADPSGDLPFSLREGELAQRALALPAERVLSGARATPSALAGLLERSDFLHFAGHARSASEGAPAFLLAAGGALEIGELGGLRSAPRWLVLSACESAAGGGPEAGSSWGLAQVLLAVGARAVVAPVRRIGDAEAYEFMRDFYAPIEAGARFDFEAAFEAAQRAARARGRVDAGLRLFLR